MLPGSASRQFPAPADHPWQARGRLSCKADEFWYVLDGRLEIRIGDEVRALGPGGFAFAPRGMVHNFRNTADTPSRVLVGFTPAGMEGFFRESGRAAVDDGPAPPLDDDEITRTMIAAPKYGVQAVAFES